MKPENIKNSLKSHQPQLRGRYERLLCSIWFFCPCFCLSIRLFLGEWDVDIRSVEQRDALIT